MKDLRYATIETLDLKYHQGAFDVYFGGTDTVYYIGSINQYWTRPEYFVVAKGKVLGPDADNVGDALAQLLDAINPIEVRE